MSVLNHLQLLTIKTYLEDQSDNSLQNAQFEIQSIIYQLGGTRDITTMSPGATALYLTILLELNK